ncbi:MAG: type II toxin-antitoxin system VapC family toxin [Saccharothrix sp.]|nr:type II toxin-antitoxin system VapC family toxin [Saccharothrix sp.]
MARLILDTGVLVAATRKAGLSTITDEDDVTVPAVVVAEYLTGVLLDGDEARSAAQRAFLKDVLRAAPVEDYTPAVAEHHAALMAYAKRSGQPRGALDLIIAATARATGRTLVTTDSRARFDELPGVEVRVVSLR